MERAKGMYGIADFVVAKNRRQATFLDGVAAMISWNRVEKLLRSGLGRTNEVTAGAKAYLAIQMFKILFLKQWYGLSDQEAEYSHDSDAAWTKKGKKYYYGYKAHTCVDVDTGLILSAYATPANYSDTGELEVLVEESCLPARSRVYADKGYTSASNRTLIKQHKCKDGIMNRTRTQQTHQQEALHCGAGLRDTEATLRHGPRQLLGYVQSSRGIVAFVSGL